MTALIADGEAAAWCVRSGTAGGWTGHPAALCVGAPYAAPAAHRARAAAPRPRRRQRADHHQPLLILPAPGSTASVPPSERPRRAGSPNVKGPLPMEFPPGAPAHFSPTHASSTRKVIDVC